MRSMTLGCSYNARKTALCVVCACAAWPNGLRFTRAAPLDRDDRREETAFQNRHDLGAAQRRRVEARVGLRPLWCSSGLLVDLVALVTQALFPPRH